MSLESGKKFEPRGALRDVLSAKDRNESLQEWKEAYVTQRIELASVQETIIQRVREQPHITKVELVAMFNDAAERGRFSDEQVKVGEAAIGILEMRRNIVRTTREKYPDDRKLYEAVFGHTPIGPVRVSAGPVALDFFCSNRIDLARAMHFDQDRPVVFREILLNLFIYTTGGAALYGTPRLPELKNMIVVRRNVGDLSFGDISVHEEQHMFRNILMSAREHTLREDKQLSSDPRTRLLDECVECLEMEIANEILALNKSGAEQTYRFLNPSVYFKQIIAFQRDALKRQVTELPKDKAEEKDRISQADLEYVVEVVGDEEFRHALWEKTLSADTAYKRMRNIGKWPEEKIAALFGFEPLSQWPKLEQRILGKRPNVSKDQDLS